MCPVTRKRYRWELQNKDMTAMSLCMGGQSLVLASQRTGLIENMLAPHDSHRVGGQAILYPWPVSGQFPAPLSQAPSSSYFSGGLGLGRE